MFPAQPPYSRRRSGTRNATFRMWIWSARMWSLNRPRNTMMLSYAIEPQTRMRIGDRSLKASLQGGERRVVVRFVLDLGHELGVDHLVVLVENDHCPRRDAGERAADDVDAVSAQELAAAHRRERHHVLQVLGRAEPAHRERQVGRDDQHGSVRLGAGPLVELPR